MAEVVGQILAVLVCCGIPILAMAALAWAVMSGPVGRPNPELVDPDRCVDCGYDMRGLRTRVTCPECGYEHRARIRADPDHRHDVRFWDGQ